MNRKPFNIMHIVIIIIVAILFGMILQKNFLSKPNIKPEKPPSEPFNVIEIYNKYLPQKQATKTLSEIIQQKQPRLDPVLIQPIANAIEKYAKEFGFPKLLILCLIEKESSFKPSAVSKVGCIGLTQINSKFHKEKLKKLNINKNQLFHIDHNIHVGIMILAEYYKQTNSIEKTLIKYVGGNQKDYVCDILASYTDLTIQK